MNTATSIDTNSEIALPITMKVRVDYLIDLVNQAIEGSSIAYWVAQARNVKRAELTIDDFTHNYCYSFEVREEGEPQWHLINVDTIRRGITKILQGNTTIHPTLQSMILRSVASDDDVIDDEALDYIVQVGLFGETVYA